MVCLEVFGGDWVSGDTSVALGLVEGRVDGVCNKRISWEAHPSAGSTRGVGVVTGGAGPVTIKS